VSRVKPGKQKRKGETRSTSENRRGALSTFDLIGLAAGGAIGSGWLAALWPAHPSHSDWLRNLAAGHWLASGGAMLVIAVVMVELSALRPRTGGLILLPGEIGGRLLATIAAAAVWIVYAVNPASEAVSMTKGLASFHWAQGLLGSTHKFSSNAMLCALCCMAFVIFLFILFPWRYLIRINTWMTVFKIAALVLITLVLLLSHHRNDPGSSNTSMVFSASNPLYPAAMTSYSVGVFAYTGFQGPLDVAGSVKEDRRKAIFRLRWAIYGTVVGSILIYTVLHYAALRSACYPHSQLYSYSYSARPGGLCLAKRYSWWKQFMEIDAIISPLGSAVVFTDALTREIAALGQQTKLIPFDLHGPSKSDIILGKIKLSDRYWLVLLIQFCVGLVVFYAVRDHTHDLATISGILILVVYSLPAVVVVTLLNESPTNGPTMARSVWDRSPRWLGRSPGLQILALFSFVVTAMIFYLSKDSQMILAMKALLGGFVVLFGMQTWAERGRKQLNLANPANPAGVLFLGYLLVLLMFSMSHVSLRADDVRSWIFGAGVILLSLGTFRGMIALSVGYLKKNPLDQ
jgi:amino acid transporter